MSKKNNRGTIETCLFFMLSPLMSIPFIFWQLYKKSDKRMVLLISLLIGILSFLFIPNWSSDKARYYERMQLFEFYSYSDLLRYFTVIRRPDFLFDNLIFIFSKLGFDINFLFFGISAFTVYSIFKFIKKIADFYFKTEFTFDILLCLLIVFSLSQSGLFSGIRFYFATSIFIWSVYYIFFLNNLWKGILFFLLTLTIHFSFAFFIPVLLIVYFFPKKLDPRIVLIFSMLFILLPKDYLSNIFGFLEMPESYANKADVYLTMERDQSGNALILSFLRNSWVYFSYIFLLFLNKDRDSKIFLIFIILLSFVNITYSMPIVFNRYTVVLKIFFLAFFIVLYRQKKVKPAYFYFLFLCFFMNFIVDTNVLRYNYLASYNFSELLTTIHIFSKKISPYDFL